MRKQKLRESLTNEFINKCYSDNFALALASIQSAKDLVFAGKEFHLQTLLNSLAKAKEKEAVELETEHLR